MTSCETCAELREEIDALKHDLDQAMAGRNAEANARISAESRLEAVTKHLESLRFEHDPEAEDAIARAWELATGRSIVASVAENKVPIEIGPSNAWHK